MEHVHPSEVASASNMEDAAPSAEEETVAARMKLEDPGPVPLEESAPTGMKLEEPAPSPLEESALTGMKLEDPAPSPLEESAPTGMKLEDSAPSPLEESALTGMKLEDPAPSPLEESAPTSMKLEDAAPSPKHVSAASPGKKADATPPSEGLAQSMDYTGPQSEGAGGAAIAGEEEEEEEDEEEQEEDEEEEEEEEEGVGMEEEEDEDDVSSSLSSSSEEERIRFGGYFDKGQAQVKQENKLGAKEKADAESSDDEIAEPPRTKNELSAMPPVPKLEAVLEDHHELRSFGSISSVLGDRLIVQTAGTISQVAQVLNEGSILWLTKERVPLGYVDEVFGPVRTPFYIVRYNEEADVPQGAVESADVSYVPDFARFVLDKDPELRKKGYDASGSNDEELLDVEVEFSDDEKEASYKKGLARKKKESAGRDELESGAFQHDRAKGRKARSQPRPRSNFGEQHSIPREGPSHDRADLASGNVTPYPGESGPANHGFGIQYFVPQNMPPTMHWAQAAAPAPGGLYNAGMQPIPGAYQHAVHGSLPPQPSRQAMRGSPSGAVHGSLPAMPPPPSLQQAMRYAHSSFAPPPPYAGGVQDPGFSMGVPLHAGPGGFYQAAGGHGQMHFQQHPNFVNPNPVGFSSGHAGFPQGNLVFMENPGNAYNPHIQHQGNLVYFDNRQQSAPNNPGPGGYNPHIPQSQHGNMMYLHQSPAPPPFDSPRPPMNDNLGRRNRQ